MIPFRFEGLRFFIVGKRSMNADYHRLPTCTGFIGFLYLAASWEGLEAQLEVGAFKRKRQVFKALKHFLVTSRQLSFAFKVAFGHIWSHLVTFVVIAQVKPSQHLEGDRPLTTEVTALTSATKIFCWCIISSKTIVFLVCLHVIAWCCCCHGCRCWLQSGPLFVTWFVTEYKRLSIFTHYVACAYNTSSAHISDALCKSNQSYSHTSSPDALCKTDPLGWQRTDFLETWCEVTTRPWLLQSF